MLIYIHTYIYVYICIYIYIKSQISDPSFLLKKWEKEEQIKLKQEEGDKVSSENHENVTTEKMKPEEKIEKGDTDYQYWEWDRQYHYIFYKCERIVRGCYEQLNVN